MGDSTGAAVIFGATGGVMEGSSPYGLDEIVRPDVKSLSRT